MKYVAYYRVSTKKQGESGLGLEAQRTSVQRFTNNCADCIVAEFTDIESGKNNDRIQLSLAIETAKKNSAQLLIAKLDRLSRNATFIFTLRDSQVDFVCADMPNANRVTIGIMAVLAQDERERISHRTKAALFELKSQGKKLGTPGNLNPEAIEKGRRIRQENALSDQNNRKAGALIISMRAAGKSFHEITKQLNTSGFRTRKNSTFQQIQVQRLYQKFALNTC